ncbi:MAG TPA: hypothetical protein VEJ43_02355 [Pseudolabrys sp.]|nr:hypothetical protein [Pseudolabrys sp.]
MRRMRYAVTVAGLVLMGAVLAGCADGFDLDKLDVFGLNEKKKLPGERKELFPGGVPGVTQGIPPEYMKGNQPPPETAQAPANDQTKPPTAAGSKTAAAEEEPKPKPKRAPKPASTRITVGGPPGAGQQSPPAPQQQPQEPWPQDSQPAQQPSQSPWPTQGQTNTASPWPSSPNSGTISR